MRLKSSTMRLLLTALTCLISGSVICQKIDTLNTNIPSNDDSYLYHDNYDHVVIAKINQILTHTMHTSTNFNSLTDLTVEIKMIPMKQMLF